MTQPAKLSQTVLGAIGSLAILCVLASGAEAACAKDSKGEVYCGGGTCVGDSRGKIWCSRFYQGGAGKTRDGKVVCGKGQCARDTQGEIFCSSEAGGAAIKDSAGHVRCYGRCERASAAQCEHTPAGTSG